MLDLIKNEKLVKRFVNFLPDLKYNECYFTAMMARKKYDNSIRRKGNNNNVHKAVIHDRERFLRTLYRYNTDERAWEDENGNNFTNKAMVIYASPNPCCMLKATNEFVKKTNDMLTELTLGRKGLKVNNLHNKLLSCIQKNRSGKGIIDIDFDIPHTDTILIDDFLLKLAIKTEDSDKVMVVKTRGGYHVMLKAEVLKDAITGKAKNLGAIVAEINKEAEKIVKADKFEIIINSNGMVPIPGTLQGGVMVDICDNEDFVVFMKK